MFYGFFKWIELLLKDVIKLLYVCICIFIFILRLIKCFNLEYGVLIIEISVYCINVVIVFLDNCKFIL